ncbi:NAD(+) diphosphatase [Piscinibacter sp. XHJ-5]|uniref:NAD(+) diphosphatase n=1 Tax=Piscinibacter sp. XHJ-5 TaxID=3037797 RepID=UPI00245364EA|nr:NAD(+) diphosphatase [Piscinibacter sp. XHJ-5]
MLFVAASQTSSPPSALAWTFAFVEGELLVPEGDIGTLQPATVESWSTDAPCRHYLGTLSSVDCWALSLREAPPGWRRMPLRAAMMALDPALGAIAGRAAQVLEWDRTHRFCGVCGTPTAIKPGERARECPACRHTAYPRLSPAMMCLVWRPGELLLARSPHFAPGRYSALAGFVEPGESLEDCLHREVAEEVGVTVRDLRYYGSQSWPFPHSLMVAFTARWTDGEIVPQAGEIEDARWFALDALPDIPPRFSISGHLILDTLEQMRANERQE